MYSIVFTVNKRNVLALCDDFNEFDYGVSLWNLHLAEDELFIKSDEYDSFFIVNEFDYFCKDPLKENDFIKKTWDSLEYRIDEEKKNRDYYDCMLDRWIYK